LHQRLVDAIEPRPHVVAQRFERASPAQVSPGEDAGALLKCARHNPLQTSSRRSRWSVRGRVFVVSDLRFLQEWRSFLVRTIL